jgi:hypothetical protein
MADQTRLSFFADVPDFTGYAWPDGAPEDISDEIKPPVSRVQVAKLGSFKHPKYGPFKVTRETFDRMLANRRAGVPTDELPIDKDHEPDLGGSTEAHGWIRGLTVEGDALYADVEWRWSGAFAIRDKAYKYVSPTWQMAYVDEYGKAHGPTLIAFGLTNRPFFNMPAVSLSQTFSRDDYDVCEEVEADQGERLIVAGVKPEDLQTFAKDLGLDKPETATEEQVFTAAREAVKQAETFKAERDAAVAERDTLKTDNEALTASATDAQKQATALNARVNSLETDAATNRFEQAFSAALKHEDGPRVAPAEKDELRELFDSNEKAFESVLAFRTSSLVPVKPTGERGEVDDSVAPRGVDADAFALDRKVQTFMREHPDKDYAVALAAVQAQEK